MATFYFYLKYCYSTLIAVFGYSTHLCTLYSWTFLLCCTKLKMHAFSESESVSFATLKKVRGCFPLSVTPLSDGMRYNCAKNMTYIPSWGIDMRGDTDRRASDSSNCIAVDVTASWDVQFFPLADANCCQNYNSQIVRCFLCWGPGWQKSKRSSWIPKDPLKLQFPLPDSAGSLFQQKKKSFSLLASITLLGSPL